MRATNFSKSSGDPEVLMGNLKRVLLLAAWLLLTVTASAQTAQGPTITLTVVGGQGFVPGARVWATGRNFREGIENEPGYVNHLFRVFVTPLGGASLHCHVAYVDHRSMLIVLPPIMPSGPATLTISQRFFSESIELPVVQAAPEIRAQGRAGHFRSQHPLGEPFADVLTFPPLIGIQTIYLFGGGFGATKDWIVRFQGPVTIELPARAFPFSEALLVEHLNFLVPLLPAGSYLVTARAASDPSLVSNTVTITVP